MSHITSSQYYLQRTYTKSQDSQSCLQRREGETLRSLSTKRREQMKKPRNLMRNVSQTDERRPNLHSSRGRQLDTQTSANERRQQVSVTCPPTCNLPLHVQPACSLSAAFSSSPGELWLFYLPFCLLHQTVAEQLRRVLSCDFMSEVKYGSRLWDRQSAVALDDHHSSKPLNK